MITVFRHQSLTVYTVLKLTSLCQKEDSLPSYLRLTLFIIEATALVARVLIRCSFESYLHDLCI
jgi:hypothetical protein